MYRFIIILFAGVLLLVTDIYAQVNTEALRRSDRGTGFTFTTNFSFSLIDGNTQQFTLRGNSRLDYIRERNLSFIVGQYSHSVLDDELYVNDGFVAVRNVYSINEPFKWELFAQQQFDDFLLLKDRKLVGTGLRSRVITPKDENSPDFTLFLGNGIMYEREDVEAVVPELTSLVRLTNYVSMNWNMNDVFSFNLVSYYQPDIMNWSDYRNTMDATLAFRLSEKLAFTLNFAYRYDSDPPVEIKPFDYQLVNGIQISL